MALQSVFDFEIYCTENLCKKRPGLLESLESKNACPLCRAEVKLSSKHSEEVVWADDDEEIIPYVDNIAASIVLADRLQLSVDAMQERGEVLQEWRWTSNPRHWVQCSKLYTEFLRHVQCHPEYVSHPVSSPPDGAIQIRRVDEALYEIRTCILDGIADLDLYTVDNHPETILVNIVFGPAYCDGFTMHQRYIMLLCAM
mgnify:CR=1 FL=1|tara:strand:+ start:636 stop:1232 length:597 start_codon:yes stop_codon:yes gene_type:complete